MIPLADLPILIDAARWTLPVHLRRARRLATLPRTRARRLLAAPGTKRGHKGTFAPFATKLTAGWPHD